MVQHHGAIAVTDVLPYLAIERTGPSRYRVIVVDAPEFE